MAVKELGRFFVGAEKERECAGPAGRSIGAVLRGEVLRELAGPARGRLQAFAKR